MYPAPTRPVGAGYIRPAPAARSVGLDTLARVASLDSLVAELERSYTELQERMADPAVYNDHREAADVGRRLKELEHPHKLAQAWRSARDDLEAARSDPELAGLAGDLETEMQRLEEELKLALVERDPADSKDVLVEVRQGVGGDEAALWAGDVARMLARYAERRGFKTEALSTSESDGGGRRPDKARRTGAHPLLPFPAKRNLLHTRAPRTSLSGAAVRNGCAPFGGGAGCSSYWCMAHGMAVGAGARLPAACGREAMTYGRPR